MSHKIEAIGGRGGVVNAYLSFAKVNQPLDVVHREALK